MVSCYSAIMSGICGLTSGEGMRKSRMEKERETERERERERRGGEGV